MSVMCSSRSVHCSARIGWGVILVKTPTTKAFTCESMQMQVSHDLARQSSHIQDCKCNFPL